LFEKGVLENSGMILMTKISTLTEQCASAHYHDEISSPDSAIILDVFGGTHCKTSW